MFLPANKKDYSVVALGTDNGTFDLRLSTYVSDKVTSTTVFNDVPVTVETKVELARTSKGIDQLIKVTDRNSPAKVYYPFTKDLSVGLETDLVVPETSIKLSENRVNSGIILEAEDLDSGVAVIYYSIDGSPFIEYTSPIHIAKDTAHAITYYSVDHAGNTEKTKTYYLSSSLDSIIKGEE